MKLHTPKEMRKMSNFAHIAEGTILAIVAIIVLVQAIGYLNFVQQLWQVIIFIAGLFLIGYILLHHGINKIEIVWKNIIQDPQQKQHLLIGFLLLFVAAILLFTYREPEGVYEE